MRLPNNCRLTGGSGKCKSLQAALIMTASVVKSDADGVGQVAKKGTYKIIKTNLCSRPKEVYHARFS
jgi:hypothetical protein